MMGLGRPVILEMKGQVGWEKVRKACLVSWVVIKEMHVVNWYLFE